MSVQKTDKRSPEELARAATHVYILIMLTVFPLFTWFDGYILLQRKRFIFFTACTVCWLVFVCVQAAVSAVRVRRLAARSYEICVLASLAACAVSAALSPTGLPGALYGANYNGLPTYLLYGCAALGVARFGRPRREYVYAAGLAYGLCCAVAFAQLLGYNALGLYPGVMTYYSPYVVEMGRFLGTAGNVDVMSAYHCLALPLLAAYITVGTGRIRLLLLLPCALGLVCLIWAGVASGLLALPVTALACAPWACVRLRRGTRGPDADAEKKCFRAACLAALLVCAAAAAVVYLVPFEGGTPAELRAVLHGELRGEFGSSRIRIWRECLSIFRDYPLFGIGPDRLLEYSDIVFSRWSEVLGETITARVDDAHNIYLGYLVSFGLVGALPALASAVCLWRGVLRRCGESGRALVMGASLLCFSIQGFFNVSTCIIGPLACVLCGLAFAEGAGRAGAEQIAFLRGEE